MYNYGWGPKERVDLFDWGSFVANSGNTLEFKVECDALTDASIECAARYAAGVIKFRKVVGVPEGGLRVASALAQYAQPNRPELPPLIADDVMTTGGSMERMKVEMNWPDTVGFVIFNRNNSTYPTPDWIKAFWEIGR